MSTIVSIIKRQPKSDRVSKSSVGYLWASEDALANWIGFILIAIAAIGVITGFYDFSAAKFSTWGNGTSLWEQLNGAFWQKLCLRNESDFRCQFYSGDMDYEPSYGFI